MSCKNIFSISKAISNHLVSLKYSRVCRLALLWYVWWGGGGGRCMAGWEAGQPCSKGPLHTPAFAAEGIAALTICSPP